MCKVQPYKLPSDTDGASPWNTTLSSKVLKDWSHSICLGSLINVNITSNQYSTQPIIL